MTRAEIGAAAEMIAFLDEVARTPVELRKHVRLVAEDFNKGYDIESVDSRFTDKSLKIIEVKTWNRNGYFHISANECAILKLFGERAWIYLVDIAKQKVVQRICNPMFLGRVRIEPVEFKYFF